MTDLTLFKPFRNLSQLNPFSTDWDGFLRNTALDNLLQHQVGGQLIPIDLTEDDKSFKVHAQIPGMKKEDIHVSIDGNQVSIRAETKQEKEEKKGDKVVLRECYYGSQYRSFTLPQAVDSGKTTAKYADGVLELIMPKSGPATGNKIAIN